RPAQPGGWERIGRGELARTAYRLGRSRATGVLTAKLPGAGRELLVLRRGHLMSAGADTGRRESIRRLERLAAIDGLALRFEGGVLAYPPGAHDRQLSLAVWARRHLENQL